MCWICWLVFSFLLFYSFYILFKTNPVSWINVYCFFFINLNWAPNPPLRGSARRLSYPNWNQLFPSVFLSSPSSLPPSGFLSLISSRSPKSAMRTPHCPLDICFIWFDGAEIGWQSGVCLSRVCLWELAACDKTLDSISLCFQVSFLSCPRR